MVVLLHPISTEEIGPQMPHSSSGPGHLPLTQKIISSTLICGTKGDKSKRFVALLFWSSCDFVRLLVLVVTVRATRSEMHIVSVFVGENVEIENKFRQSK